MSNPKIIYGDVAPGADTAASVNTTPAESFTNPALLPFGGTDNSLITLERNEWTLDSSKDYAKNEPAFWSVEVSNEEAAFLSPPTITITFPANYSVTGLTFNFCAGEWCAEMVLKAYRDATLLQTITLNPSSSFYVYDGVITAFNKLVLEMVKTSVPYRRAKLNRLSFGVVREYDKDELTGCSVVEEINLTSTEISINTLKFSMLPKSSAELLFQKRQPLSVYNGNNLLGVFYLKAGKQTAANAYEISAEDAIGTLEAAPFSATKYSGANAATVLAELLSGYDYELDNALTAETLTGYIPKGTKREALHHIAFALRAVVDTTGGKIRIYRASEGVTATFNADREYVGGAVEKTPSVTAVRVTSHLLFMSNSGNIRFDGDDTRYEDITSVYELVNPLRVASDPDNVIEIEKATLINSNNVAAVAQWVLSNAVDYATTLKAKMLIDNEKPGDYVEAITPTGETITGYLTKSEITFSGVVAANVEIKGGLE